jgi:hypothetical protein
MIIYAKTVEWNQENQENVFHNLWLIDKAGMMVEKFKFLMEK